MSMLSTDQDCLRELQVENDSVASLAVGSLQKIYETRLVFYFIILLLRFRAENFHPFTTICIGTNWLGATHPIPEWDPSLALWDLCGLYRHCGENNSKPYNTFTDAWKELKRRILWGRASRGLLRIPLTGCCFPWFPCDDIAEPNLCLYFWKQHTYPLFKFLYQNICCLSCQWGLDRSRSGVGSIPFCSPVLIGEILSGRAMCIIKYILIYVYVKHGSRLS